VASQFKNRLVGVTILVASVVIFLPSIIDGKKMAYEDEFVATPIKPEIKAHTLTGQQDGNESATVSSEEQASGTLDKSTNETAQAAAGNGEWEVEEVAETITLASTEVVKEPEIQSAPAVLEKAWTIQLGAFQNAQNINLLLKKLHKAGFQAHTVPTEVIDGELTRVFVGPNVSKSKLEKQLPRLKHLTQLNGKIMPFNAVSP
jgi:DedD protein